MTSMTPASADYFEKVAGQWDDIRSGYFTAAVRQSAIKRAYLRSDMVVADVGAGTGFMADGLAPLVKQVHVLDGSPAMLDVARRNLAGHDNIIYHTADGASLPLADASMDAVFANMYLHHCPDPLAALREMARLLRPGGRLVISDMDAHTYAWFKEEMADVWLGFERAQLRDWFREAGLVNIIVDCSGESCCAESQNPEQIAPDDRTAHVSIFVAVGARPVSGVADAVQAGYGAIAQGETSSCCSPSASSISIEPLEKTGNASCCGDSMQELLSLEEVQYVPGYTPTELAQVPQEAAEITLGCGNPVAMAGLKPGEVVLDIGSGGGMDAMLAARRVGAQGRVIGVDMTPAMLDRARKSAARAGLANVEFRQGRAESLPVEDASIDVIISNCVINLCADKGAVFNEAFRVLKPGGRLEVSDMVTDGAFPPDLRADPAMWSGCVFGALPEQEYLDLLAQAGFTRISAQRSSIAGEAAGVKVYSLAVSAYTS